MKKINPIKLTKKNVLVLLFLIAVLFIFLYLNERDKFPNEGNTGTKLGQYAPDFQTEYLNGEKFKLSDLKGKPLILNFWATWCPPCVREMPLLQKLHNEGKITVIGVNLQENERTIEEFTKKLNITFPIVLDKDGSVEAMYNVLLKPTTYFIDENGVIVDKKFGELTENDIKERTQKLLE